MVSTKKAKLYGDIFAYVILIICSLIFILPLVWMLLTSLKSYDENISFIPTFLPQKLMFENYRVALFEFIPYFKYFTNSIFLVVVGTFATVITATIVAYGFSRFKVKENNFFFMILLGTMMLPPQVTMISSYVIWAKLYLVNTYVPLLIGCFFGGSAFYIFLAKQFISGLPIDYEEAAQIDGANKLQIFFKIIIPLLKPLIAAISIFSFQSIWNDYMGPLIYIKDVNLYTVAQSLTLFDMPHETLWGEMMAASLVTILPIVIIFAFFQKYFISGITLGGVKG